MLKPELCAPAGDYDKLCIALNHGADAVYVGTSVFGLRKYSKNFSLDDLDKACKLVKKQHKKLYLALNSFAHNEDLKQVRKYLAYLKKIRPTALIVADIGVLEMVKEYLDIPIHISTQTSILNSYTASFYAELGAKRVVLARELTLKEIETIKKRVGLELEVFIHGAMCAGYAGKCYLSNYTSNRDANRGGCVQNCRHNYQVESSKKKTLLNSKDLRALALIPDLMKIGVHALKIEGRMKSAMYIANTVRVYRKAIDEAYLGKLTSKKIEVYEEELAKVSNRGFCLGGLSNDLQIDCHFLGYQKQIEIMGIIQEVKPKQGIIVEIKNAFFKGDNLQVISNQAKDQQIKVQQIFDLEEQEVSKTKPNTRVFIPMKKTLYKYDLLIKPYKKGSK
jgi:putative protease